MSNRLPPEMLRRLRNEIPITLVIAEFLKLPTKVSEGHFRFLCPLCTEFITATNPKTNLARCFLCEKNFNPIDMVMIAKQVSFSKAVDYLKSIKAV
jgi:DNA primase